MATDTMKVVHERTRIQGRRTTALVRPVPGQPDPELYEVSESHSGFVTQIFGRMRALLEAYTVVTKVDDVLERREAANAELLELGKPIGRTHSSALGTSALLADINKGRPGS